MATAYGIGSDRIADAFARIEEELFEGMFRNLDRHRADEDAAGVQWTQWQAAQIAELERYARDNGLRYGERFDRLNEEIDRAIGSAYAEAWGSEEARLFAALRDGGEPEGQDGFLRMPRDRMDALVRATHNDMVRAEHATLRKAEDIYRQTIFSAQVYATSGAGTYGKAVDMATRDFLSKGINGIRYRNGSMHGIEEYSRMAVRTATKRAALAGEGDARRRRGIHTVYVDARSDACPECMEWVGRVLIDDVYSGGTAEESSATGYPLLSEAMARGLFHPNCRDTMSTYIEGISEMPEEPTENEKLRAEAREAEEQRLDEAEDNAERYRRLERFSLDHDGQIAYGAKAEEWEERAEELKADVFDAEAAARRMEDAGMSRKQAADCSEIIGKADPSVRRVAEKNLQDLKFDDVSHRRKDDAFYRPSSGGITINMNQVASGDKFNNPYEVFFHEFGHLIDHQGKIGTVSHDMGLGDMVKKEVNDLLKAIKAREGFDSIYYAKEYLANEVMELARNDLLSLGGVSDLIGGATRGSVVMWGTTGHANSYWSGAAGMQHLSTEAFAEFFECAMTNPAGLDNMKRYFPKSYELFLEILERL